MERQPITDRITYRELLHTVVDHYLDKKITAEEMLACIAPDHFNQNTQLNHLRKEFFPCPSIT